MDQHGPTDWFKRSTSTQKLYEHWPSYNNDYAVLFVGKYGDGLFIDDRQKTQPAIHEFVHRSCISQTKGELKLTLVLHFCYFHFTSITQAWNRNQFILKEDLPVPKSEGGSIEGNT